MIICAWVCILCCFRLQKHASLQRLCLLCLLCFACLLVLLCLPHNYSQHVQKRRHKFNTVFRQQKHASLQRLLLALLALLACSFCFVFHIITPSLPRGASRGMQKHVSLQRLTGSKGRATRRVKVPKDAQRVRTLR